mmetsp:Transcript_93144/g.147236  ORF Transcript_93144/g.147236 Transcript_93144/m.147236 type:complete len:80 (+) Transcript_93144:64-303(+)
MAFCKAAKASAFSFTSLLLTARRAILRRSAKLEFWIRTTKIDNRVSEVRSAAGNEQRQSGHRTGGDNSSLLKQRVHSGC